MASVNACPSRRILRITKPLLPLGSTTTSCPSHNDTSLASNASEVPMQTLKLPPASLMRHVDLKINIPGDSKENENPQAGGYLAPRPPRRRSRSSRASSGSLYRRVYHHEPYPAFSNHDAISPLSTDSILPHFSSPTSPNLKQPFFPMRLQTTVESSTFWLSLYFCFNLGLTLCNKGVLVHFPFPYTLSALHALFGTIGATLLANHGHFVPSRLSHRETAVLLAFSILYAVNIVVSNISLQLVTVPFHQVVRAATPIFTIFFSGILFGAECSWYKKISLIPVVAGVGLATFGDYYFNYAGFFLTLLGSLLAALKTIFTNVLQSPTPIVKELASFQPFFKNSFDLLFFLSPFALVECVFMAHVTGELTRVREYSHREMSSVKVMALALNGCIAFGLNIVSFSANRRVGALGMTVAANVKQVLTIVLAVFIFNLTITTLNAAGIVLTLVGGAWFAWIEFVEKLKQSGVSY